jgi:hypothetical protein
MTEDDIPAFLRKQTTLDRDRKRYQTDPKFAREMDELARLIAFERARREPRTLRELGEGYVTKH